jgi:hypothetical protein
VQRHLLKIMAATSLVLSVTTAIFWAQSFRSNSWYPEYLHLQMQSNGVIMHSWWGRLFVMHVEFSEIQSDLVFVTQAPQVAGWRGQRKPAVYLLEQKYPRAITMTAPAPYCWSSELRNGFGFDRTVFVFPPPGSMRETWIVIPWWAIWSAATLPILVYAANRVRASRRFSIGACVHCGYDLRATPDRCPECGAIPEKLV